MKSHIRSLVEHKKIVSEDLARFGNHKPEIKDFILGNEQWYVYKFLYHLRNVEYYIGKKNFQRLFFYWHFYCFKRLCHKLNVYIAPFSVLGG